MSLRQFGAALLATGLLATPALAQTAASTAPTTKSSGSSTGSSLMGDRLQVTHGGYLSSKLVGATVYNDQKQSIGSIDNLIVGSDGKISTAVISVGGFLGVGSKLVDVPFSRLQFQQDGKSNGREVVLPNASQQSLKSMQDFTYNG